MRIVVDMQGAQSASRFRGIGRYTNSFVKSLVKNRDQHEIILVLNGLLTDTIDTIRGSFYELLPQESIRVWYAPGPVFDADNTNVSRRNIAEIIREDFIASLEPDIVHITSFFEGYGDDAVTSIGRFDKVALVSVTLYDLIPIVNSKDYLETNLDYKKYYQRKLHQFKQANLYLSISEAALQEGAQHLSKSKSCFTTIGGAVEDVFKPQTYSLEEHDKLYKKYSVEKPFVLYFGGSEPRKNVSRLIKAFSGMSKHLRSQYQLVIAGGLAKEHYNEFDTLTKKLGFKKTDVCFTGRINDSELVQFYNLCELFVFPSWHEGFGLPVLEAMSCGAPVIASNVTSMPEIIGLEEAFFDPFDVSSITKKMTQALEDDNFRQKLRAHALQQANKFSWDKTAKLAISAFESAFETSSGNNLATSKEKLNYELAKYIGLKDVKLQIQLACCLSLNTSPSNEKQLLVDVSEIVQFDAKSGIQRVVRAVLNNWLQLSLDDWKVRPVYATRDEVGYRYANVFTQRILGLPDKDFVDDFVDASPGDIFLGLDFQTHILSTQLEFLKMWHRHGVNIKFVVYDLLSVLMPNAFPEGAKDNFWKWLEIISIFDGAVCISKSVANELKLWLDEFGPVRNYPFEITWFHLGADTNNSLHTSGLPKDAPYILSLLSERTTFLTVSTLEPRKGQEQILDAFEILWEKNIQVNLVLVGKKGWMVEKLVKRIQSHSRLGKNLFWLKGVSDEYLEKIYQESSCLIAASEGEGFGLPLIEAAQHKLPIIARDIPVFKEVAGNNAYYFANTNDPQVIAKAITNWLELDALGDVPLSQAIPWMTWNQSAQQLLKIVLNSSITKEKRETV